MNFVKPRSFFQGNVFRLVIEPSLPLRNAGWLTLLVALSVVNLSACNEHQEVTGKILVTVNGDAITAHQLDAELRFANGNNTGKLTELTEPSVRKQALETLINRRLLLTEAVRQKIDRNPEVMDFIERFRTQVIVQAFLDSMVANAGKPSNVEIQEYFNAHPDLYAHRKIFEIQQLSIATLDYSVDMKQVMDKANSLHQVALWLDAKKIAYIQSTRSYTSADMPAETTKNLQTLGRSRLFILEDGDQTLLCALNDLRDSPLTNQAATPQIEHQLFVEKMEKVAVTEIAKLRSSSKVDYVANSSP